MTAEFVVGDTICSGDEVAHYGSEFRPAHYGFWKALTRCYALVIRLWEAPGADIRRGSFSSRATASANRRARRPNHKVDEVPGSREGMMDVSVGDRVEVQPRSVNTRGRLGTVEAVLKESPLRYQVRWDNNRWSIIAPTDSALRVVSRDKRTTPATATPQPKN